ncbi:phospholipase/carboxylesterase family protein [Xylariaceae sp. FL0594]|nr:phospholipase/carboxylesterase family protein [Xylariaceae sp. FL0594]
MYIVWVSCGGGQSGPRPGHEHTHTVIFLHGRGDNIHDFWRGLNKWVDSRGRTLDQAFPTFRFVLPEAPQRQVAAAAPNNVVWNQWFDVWDTTDFSHKEELLTEGLRDVIPHLRLLIAHEASQLPSGPSRIILAGISMGGATSAHLLFNLEVPLGAFMGFSCRCPFAGSCTTLAQMREVLGVDFGLALGHGNETLRGTPVLLEHCADDPLVRVQNGRGLRDTLKAFGCQVEWKEYPTGGHWFNSPDGMDNAVRFLEEKVAGKAQS